MEVFLDFLVNFYKSFLGLFDTVTFTIGGISVSVLDVLLAVAAMSMVISIFWKGARST